jgi:hypothetical protein
MTADPLSAGQKDAQRPYREVTDSHRVYRVGETDRDVLGHCRKLMIYLVAAIALLMRRPGRGTGSGAVPAARPHPAT